MIQSEFITVSMWAFNDSANELEYGLVRTELVQGCLLGFFSEGLNGSAIMR